VPSQFNGLFPILFRVTFRPHRTIAIGLVATCLLFLSTGTPIHAQGGTIIRLDPSSSTIAINATTIVNVRIENVSNLAGAEVHLTFDSTLIQVQKIDAGGFPSPDFVAQSNFAGGKIDYAIAQMPPHQPVNGSGVLLQITLTGKAAGTSPLNFSSAVLANNSGGQIPSTSQNGSITIAQPVTPTRTPSPSTTATATATSSTTPTPIQPTPTRTMTPQPSVSATPTIQPPLSATPTATATAVPWSSVTATPTAAASGTPTPSRTPVVAIVRVLPSAFTLRVNSVGIAKVRIDNAAYLWGADLKLTYDPAIVECVNAAPGIIPKPDIVAKNSCGGGAIEYIVSQQAPTEPAGGGGDALQFTLKCLQSGSSSLHFDRVVLTDRDGQALLKVWLDAQITCAPAPDILGYHYVRAGDGLYCIARAYGVSPWAIANENGLVYPYYLTVGQKLAIPNVPWQSGSGPICQRQFDGVPPPPPPVCRATYLVRYGDTLSSIAWRYRTTVWTLAAANHLPNPNWIRAGQWLCIP